MISSSTNNNEEKIKSTIHLFGINLLVCGVEIASSCYFAYIPPMLLKAGFSNSAMTISLGIAPIANFMTAPILAKWSDGCSSKLGRRKPFIIAISAIMTFSMLLIPISSYFINRKVINLPTSITLLACAVIMFSYGYHAIFNPCQSLLVDLSVSKRSQAMDGFRIYSTCMFLGCIVGYFVASYEWKLPRNSLSQEELSFFIVAVLFNVCLLISLSFAKEKPYAVTNCDIQCEVGGNNVPCETWKKTNQWTAHKSGPTVGRGTCLNSFAAKLYTGALSAVQLEMCSLYSSVLKILLLPVRCCRHIQMSSTVIQKLFMTELFGWMAFLCHNMFFTVFVSQHFFKNESATEQNSKAESQLYDAGMLAGSWALLLQSVTACIYALFLQHHLVAAVGCKAIFVGELAVFAGCMGATLLTPSIGLLTFITALSGFGSTALTTFPGMLVSIYNEDRKLYLWDARTNNNARVDLELGVGSDVAVLDMAFFLSQIILALVVGPLVDLFGSPLLYIIFACAAGAFSVGCGTKVVCDPVDLSMVRNCSYQAVVV